AGGRAHCAAPPTGQTWPRPMPRSNHRGKPGTQPSNCTGRTSSCNASAPVRNSRRSTASAMADIEALRGAWLNLVLSIGGEVGPGWAAFTNLASRYAAPERYYHNLDHIADMLATVDRLCDLAQDLAAVRFAVWFHDAVYDSRASDNEEGS